MTQERIRLASVDTPDIANHGEVFENYEHNKTPVLAVLNSFGSYELLTGGHRYNSAIQAGEDSIEALVIEIDQIDFDKYTWSELWDMNDETEIVKALGL